MSDLPTSGSEWNPRLAVIVPAYNAAATLPACLSALKRSTRRPDEIILFDDGSTDDTRMLARNAGVRVIDNGGRAQGPAVGRNAGALATRARTLLFVDADVALAPNAIARLEAPIVNQFAVATFGSYDDRPLSKKNAALYANLRHHWVHQQGRENAFTFWSGIGAIDRTTFLQHGGFDPAFRKPSIEDIELGVRVIEAGGRVRLVKDAFGKHLKEWTLVQLWQTDIFYRAVPWARLIQSGRGAGGDLNVSRREQLAAVFAHLILVCTLLSIVEPLLWPMPIVTVAAYLALNAHFFRFLWQSAGPMAGFVGMGLHWCYHLYSSVAYMLVKLLSDRRSLPKPNPNRTHDNQDCPDLTDLDGGPTTQ
jgi:GT2 family glycosyltransferase